MCLSLKNNNKESKRIGKETPTSNQPQTQLVEEGENHASNNPPKDIEIEASVDLTCISLPNTSGEGPVEDHTRTSSLGGTWETMVKQSKISQMVMSPSQSSSQGSQEIPEQAPPPSTMGRKTQRHHAEQET